MKGIIQGLIFREGTYEGTPFSNVNFHVVTNSSSTPGFVGRECVVEKVRKPLADMFFAEYGLTPSTCVGKEVRVNHDRYGRVEEIEMVTPRVCAAPEAVPAASITPGIVNEEFESYFSTPAAETDSKKPTAKGGK